MTYIICTNHGGQHLEPDEFCPVCEIGAYRTTVEARETRIEELEGELGECLTWIGNTKNHAPYEAAGATWRTRHNEDQREIAKLKSDLAALQLKWTDGEKIARLFHETYERFAPAYNYETRSDTKEFDPDTENGRLMIAVVKSVALAIQQPQEDADG